MTESQVPLGLIRFRDIDPEGASEFIRSVAVSASHDGVAYHVHLLNMYSLAIASESDSFRKTIISGSLNLIDGRPLTWLLRNDLGRRPRQIRGPQLFEDCLSLKDQSDLRHFFLGGSNECLTLLQEVCRARFPGANIVGSYSPPFRELTEAEISEELSLIQASGANLVWVGLGTPKQDYVAARIASRLNLTSVAVGAAFNFTAGLQPTAPPWVRRFAMEWLYRLISEPKRLWRRYTIGSFKALVFILRNR